MITFRLDFQNYLLIVTSLANFFLFLFVLLKSKKEKNNLFFALLALGVTLWTFGMFMYRGTVNSDLAVFWTKLYYVAASITPFSLLFFGFYFPDNILRVKKRYYIPLFMVGVFFIILPVFDNAIVRNVLVKRVGENEIHFGKYLNIWGWYLSLYFVLAFGTLIKKYFLSSGVIKQQLRYIIVGSLVSTLIGTVTNHILPLYFNNPTYAWIGPSGTIIMICFIAYAITRYRLMGIRLIASQLYTYLIIAAFAYLYFHLVLWLDYEFFGGVYEPRALALGVILAIFFALVFLPFINKVQKSSDVIFYKGYNPRSIIKDLVLRLSSVLNFEQLIEALTAEFRKILATEEIEVIVFGNNGGKPDLIKSDRLKSVDDLSQAVIESKDLVIREETKDRAVMRIMDDNNVRIAAPLMVRDRVIGMVLLGEKIEQGAYLQEDIEFLQIISSQAAAAIENARLYKEVEGLNQNLQQKVDEQTADIRDKNEALEKLLVMRSEFLDIASHQLRTPVSVMKGMLSMFQENSVPEDKKKMFLDMAFQKAIKLSEIIDDILNASEMDSKRFALSLGPVDIKEVLDEVYRDKEITAQKKSLEFKLELPEQEMPKVTGDPRYLKQVFHNLVNNSMQYTQQGFIKIMATLENGKVVVRVSDSGLGIPPEDLPKLFQKFARANNAVDAYADGSGLGLYIIKEIIDKHPGGKIEIEKTELGKGTTFRVELQSAAK